ncbi:sensor histidine kinase [Catellatospora sichuanensis]|uniref:sensor histidine kinase n=1 Tax=Catellatospora sichuanensis TaxID=1969805 RepID=UPI00118298D5|nr:histidine kinase [Catellatospora sichuanensis]
MGRRAHMAQALLITTLAAWFVARSGFVFSGDYGPSGISPLSGVIAVGAVGGLAATVLLIGSRRPSSRAMPWVMAGQAALAFGPYLLMGEVWGPVAGAVVASVLFTMPRRISWLTAALLIALDVGLSAVFGEAGADGFALVGRLVIDVLVGSNLFGVMLLTDLTRRVAAERAAHAALAVAEERFDNAERLRVTLGTDLSSVVRLSRLGLDGEQARARLSEIAATARRAAHTARSIIDTRRQPSGGQTDPDAVSSPTTTISPRLAWSFTLATTVNCALLVLVNFAFYVQPSFAGWVLVLLTLAVSAVLQMYHGAPQVTGHPARRWRWTLPLHLVILTTAVAVSGPHFAPTITLAAGAVLYRWRPPWSFGVLVIVTAELLLVLRPGATFGDHVYLVAGLAGALIQVYAFCRLPEVARELAEAREGLARLAVVRERLRVTRDVHDLLGLSITGISLKCELITRLVDTDPARARREFDELAALALRGLADIQAAVSGTSELRFAEELRAVCSLLDASGIRTEVVVSAVALPADIDTLLATVVREAVTNVVRHATAGTCRITLTVRDEAARLRVADDGNPGRTVGAGTGLVNLGARLAAAGGRLDAEPDGDGFVLTAHVPLRPVEARLHPARLGRDPDRVDPVPGVEFGHR